MHPNATQTRPRAEQAGGIISRWHTIGRRRSRAGRAFAGVLVNLGLSATAVLLTLVAAEAGVRLLTRTSPSLLVADPVVGKRFLPGFASRVFVPECDCEVDVRFNRDGLRGPDRPQAKPQGVRRIALVGDSMVAAVATAEEQHARPQARADARRRAPGRDLGGDERGRLELEHRQRAGALPRGARRRYAPELVVLVFWVGNDLADNSLALTQAPRLYFDLDPDGRLRQLPFAFQPNPVVGVARPDEPPLRVAEGGAAAGAGEPARSGWSGGSGRARLRLARARRGRPRVGHHGSACCARSRRRRGRAGRSWCSSLRRRPSRCTTTSGPSSRGARPGRGRRSRATIPKSGWASSAGRRGYRSWRSPPRSGPRPRTATRRGSEEQLYYEGRFHWNDAGNALAAARVRDFALTMVP